MLFPIEPSPDDPRDKVYEHRPKAQTLRSVRSFPNSLDLSKFLNFPRNQGSRGTCASFAASSLKEYHERLDTNYQGYFSPESVYFYRPNKPDSGMFLRDVMKILKDKGIAREDDFVYQSEDPETIPEQAVETAKDFKIKEYNKITTIDGLKEALANYGPCIIAFPAYDNRPEFWRPKNDTTRNGGHAVAVVGYNSKGFILRNSWGFTWNGNGTVIYPYSEWGVHWEIWAAIDDESPSQFPEQSVCEKIKTLLVCLN